MFQPTTEQRARSRRWGHGVSALLHVAVLAALIYRPEPQVLKANPVMRGAGGSSVALIFSGADRDSDAPAAYEPRRERLRAPVAAKKNKDVPSATRHPEVAATKNTGNAARAGAPNGSALFGDLRGRDVRPAIPLAWADPEVFPWQVPNEIEGRVVVEITIDAQGAVIDAKVIESLHQTLDEKVLAAAWKWRFRPATVDGVPIASRQDLVFRFPS